LQFLIEMNDSGFLVGGSSWSIPSGNKTSFSFGLTDYWIIRLDAAGNKLWEQPYGGTGRNELYAAWIVGNETGWRVTPSPATRATRPVAESARGFLV
jgi:hypothetical protein